MTNITTLPNLSYTDKVIAAAERAYHFKTILPKTLYLNLYQGKHGISTDADESLDVAAEEAALGTLGLYLGTILVQQGKRTRFLDLTPHGDALLQERENDQQLERDYVRGLTIGAGRSVL